MKRVLKETSERSLIYGLDKSIVLLNSVIDEFETTGLRERINVEGNKASVVIDSFDPPSLFKNLRKILGAARKFVDKVYSDNLRGFDSYLKYFRLLSEDGNRTSYEAGKRISDGYWKRKWPFQTLSKGKVAVDSFISEMNSVIAYFNSRAAINEKIKPISLVKWVHNRKRWDESAHVSIDSDEFAQRFHEAVKSITDEEFDRLLS